MICVNKIQIHSRFPVELESTVEHSTFKCAGGVKTKDIYIWQCFALAQRQMQSLSFPSHFGNSGFVCFRQQSYQNIT